MRVKLRGRALAEAAAVCMGWHVRKEAHDQDYGLLGPDGYRLNWLPDKSPSDDYECMEWVRKNWMRHHGDTVKRSLWWLFLEDMHFDVWDYRPGDYAKALVGACRAMRLGGEGEANAEGR